MSGFLDKIRDCADNHYIILRKAAGLVVSLVTLLAMVGCISYVFTWKQDQSLLLDPAMMGQDAGSVANIGGKLGLKLAALLMARWFGLGAFAVIAAMVIVSIRLLFGKRRFSVLRYVLLALTGALLLSFILAYFSLRLGMDSAFGGGLGGGCGSQVIQWMESMVGSPVTLCIIISLCIAWGYFMNSKFSKWLLKAGEACPMEETPKKPARTFNFVAEDKVEKDVQVNADVHGGDDDSHVNAEVPVVPEPAVKAQPAAKPSDKAAGTAAAAPASVQPETAAVAPKAGADGIKVVGGDGLSTEVQADLPRIDVREELENYSFPPLSLLKDYSDSIHNVSSEELKRNNFKIRATLVTYKIGVDEVEAIVGPTITLYKVHPSQGVKISSIMNLHKEIAMALNSSSIRILMLPDSVGIEVPNDSPSVVPLKALLNNDEFRNSKAELPVAIGYTITQKVKVFDLADAPHLLVAGATKQGKSVGLNVLVASLLYAKHPSELKFVFIDPKMVEFSAYNHLLKHYLAVLPTSADEEEEAANAIVKKAPAAEAVLRSLCIEMDERYELLSKAGVNNIVLYNDKYRDRHLLPTEGHHFLPYIVTVIDEYADLTMSTGAGGEARNMARSITNSIIRLAQKGRAAGIHIVLATQRPSVDIITGAIKTNFPTRIAFRVISRVDSQTILDSPGAEKLIGRGDMLYYAGVSMERVQCALISNSEIDALTKYIGSQSGYKKSYNTPYYLPAPDEGKTEDGTSSLDMNDLDERFEEAARLVVTSQKGSTSDLQRRLGMGYAKAGRVMDQLEAAGVVGPQEGSKPRQVLIADLDELELKLREMKGA